MFTTLHVIKHIMYSRPGITILIKKQKVAYLQNVTGVKLCR